MILYYYARFFFKDAPKGVGLNNKGLYGEAKGGVEAHTIPDGELRTHFA